jgi:hypothetical protein
MHVIGPPDFGNCKMTCRPLNQADAKSLFQHCDTAAELGFRYAQRPACRSKAAMIHGLDIVIEVIQVLHKAYLIVPKIEL